jgi:2,3-bisphosphoglycerate-independent phosphoglycerate mutase
MNKKVGLIILDGWGIGDQSQADAVYQANTPYMDHLMSYYPNGKLTACGAAVGLPEGQMGNSEVGHLNIGAGRIVYQELSRINNAIKDRSFFINQTLLDALDYASKNQCKIHLLGLVSNGGVHSAFNHLEALIDLCKEKDAKKVFIHAITDGRDCDPKSAITDFKALERSLTSNIKIASVIGRYYAMDRDRRWERVEKAYNLYVNGEGVLVASAKEAIQKSYEQGITDEFINPILCDQEGLIEPGDVVISFNFRTDRPREIAEVLSQHAIEGFNMKPLELYYVTMTTYDESFTKMHVVFQKDNLEVKSTLISYVKQELPDFFCLNFANPDMVGHTGVYDATVKAVETVDNNLKEIIETLLPL